MAARKSAIAPSNAPTAIATLASNAGCDPHRNDTPPTISVSFLPGGESNWSGLIQSLAHALEPDPGRTASFSEIGIHEGTVIVHNEYGGKDLTDRLEGVEFQLAWPSISRSFGANGRFVWHDEPIEASLTLSDFLAALSGELVRVKGSRRRGRSASVLSGMPVPTRPA